MSSPFSAASIRQRWPRLSALSEPDFAGRLRASGALLKPERLRTSGYTVWLNDAALAPPLDASLCDRWLSVATDAQKRRSQQGETDVRRCHRCNSLYRVEDNGNGQCRYHSLRFDGRPGVRKYECCGGSKTSLGCCRGGHVTTDNTVDPALMGLDEFVRVDESDRPPRALALDTESAFTKNGMTIVSVAVVDKNFHCVYSADVDLDESEIVDWNTSFSGVSAATFRRVARKQPEVVRHELCSVIGRNDILVGQGVYHDLIKLKIVHENVVDTAILFANNGRKQKLSVVCTEKLGMCIQEPSANGHSPLEDAEASMALAWWWLDKHY